MDQNDHHDDVFLGLGLGLGFSEYKPKKDNSRKNKRLFFVDLSIPFPQNNDHGNYSPDSSSNLKNIGEDKNQGSKNSYGSKEDDDSNSSREFSRKKLRLTRDQTTLLEDSFKQHSTLNTAQKQLLAERLNLKPRQVEVWFQNRRARTKLKQTEVDCQYLKKNCERLSEENRRLKKEVLELRSLLKMERPHPPPPVVAPPPPTTPFFRQIPKVAASGEKNGKNRGGGEKQDGAVMKVVHRS